MSYDEYQDVHHTTPYTFTIQSGLNSVYYFGERHSFSPTEMDRETSEWADFDFSLEAMKKVHTEFFGIPFDQNDGRFFYNLIDPTQSKTIFNKISRITSEIRDRYIVKEIEKYVHQGYSVFVQYGASHAVMQEPLLREIL
ncbi:MAG: hypothetical protein RJB39_703 [Candidatus Parcubacteria bacterium]|jgi:hypothetical protein